MIINLKLECNVIYEKKYLDIYSRLAIVFVVMIHSNAYYLQHISIDNISILNKLLTTIVNSALPMFIFDRKIY